MMQNHSVDSGHYNVAGSGQLVCLVVVAEAGSPHRCRENRNGNHTCNAVASTPMITERATTPLAPPGSLDGLGEVTYNYKFPQIKPIIAVFREIGDELWEIVQKYLPPTKPHIGRPRCDPRGLINGIPYVLTTGCSWLDVPEKCGTKSTVHRYRLEFCENSVYQAIFLDLLRSGYENKKNDLSHCATGTKDISAKKEDQRAMMAINKWEQTERSGRSERAPACLYSFSCKYP